MAEIGQRRERLREIFLRFQTERLAALGRKLTARKSTPDLSPTKLTSNQSTATQSEKGWYYLNGFLDGINLIKAIARTSPERLPALLKLKGGDR